jgi:hypothetical protein
MVRKVETFPPVTMGHIRGHGCRDFAVDQNAFQRAMALGKGWRPFFFAVRPLVRTFRAGLRYVSEGESYRTIDCLACRLVHVVNPVTGKVLGESEEE